MKTETSQNRERPPPHMVMANSAFEWIAALLVFAALFAFMWEYHRWRDRPLSIFTANKATAIAASLCFCLALTLGPVSRFTGRLTRAVRFRRALACTAAFFMTVHLFLSLLLVERFDLAYFVDHWLSWIFGSLALGGFGAMWFLSFPAAVRRRGFEAWIKVHRLGYIFLALIVIHIVCLGKVANCLKWLETLDKPVPPGTTVPSAAIVLTLIVRLVAAVRSCKESSRQ